MHAAAELVRNPVSNHNIQPEYGDEQADAGRDFRTRLARPNFSGANGDREKIIQHVQLTTSWTGNLTRLILTLAKCDNHRLYIHTVHTYCAYILLLIGVSLGVSVCVFSSHSFWTSSSLDVPAGVTQEEGHTGFLVHLLSAVRAFIFLARRIQPFLSLVDREVEYCVLTT